MAENRIVFDGKYYEAWRMHIVSGIIAQETLTDLLELTPYETIFLNTDPAEYSAAQKKYLVRQEKAKSFIFNRLTLPILNQVRRCATVYEILQKLDNEYRLQSSAAESMARRAFYGMRFIDGNNMHQYLKVFRDTADQLRDAGSNISDREEIKQLIASLSSTYDVAITNYEIFVANNKSHSYERLRRFLIDRYERDLEDRKLRPRYSNLVRHEQANADRNSHPRRTNPPNGNSTQSDVPVPAVTRDRESTETSTTPSSEDTGKDLPKDSVFQKSITCHKCGGLGHFASECPSRLKKENTGLSTYEERRANAIHM